ncbi:hypothetical protein, partial [Actinokineospora enzanensis]|uniref:hypothetical protein n=1 Tax=Actinokineospora enzanensis TaxID=155975 RepID=UPI0012EC7825
MSNHVLHRSYITIGALPGGCDLTEEVRALNAAGVRIPWAWTITHERLDPNATDQNALTVGVNNGVGAVEYEEGDRTYVPTIGTNSDWVTYHFGGAEETGLPPFSEVPI